MRVLEGIGFIVGLMLGAGIFALPFIVFKAGLFWGVLMFVAVFGLSVLLHFLYAEISFFTKGRHRFTGYVRIILGENSERLAFLITLFSYYGVLLIYGVLGGIFLFNLLPLNFLTKEFFSILFFLAGGFLLFLKLEKIGVINFWLSVPLFGFLLYLFFISLPFVKLSNFSWGLNNIFDNGAWFLPYGAWIFSLNALAAIPDAKDVLEKSSVSRLKKIILFSLILCSVFYGVFVFFVIGVSGSFTTKDALSGLLPFLGDRVIVVGSAIGFLAVFTSFLVVALDLEKIFIYDFKFSKLIARPLVIVPPILFFVLGFQDFSKAISLIGSVGLGFTGIMIIFMFYRVRRKKAWIFALVPVLLAAVCYEIWNLL